MHPLNQQQRQLKPMYVEQENQMSYLENLKLLQQHYQ